MKERYIPALCAVMYLCCFAALFLFLGTDLTVFRLSHTEKFITAFSVFVFGFAGAYFRCSHDTENKFRIIKRTVVLLFSVYLLIVIDFTLTDDSFGRNISSIFLLKKGDFWEYLSGNTNLIPFATVKLFFEGWRGGYLSLGALAENILGNFCVFMPFAFFMPIIFKRLYTFWKFTAAVAVTVIIIELLQLLFLTGAGDIDDFLLNVSGAAAFCILKIKRVSKLLSRLTFGVWQYEE